MAGKIHTLKTDSNWNNKGSVFEVFVERRKMFVCPIHKNWQPKKMYQSLEKHVYNKHWSYSRDRHVSETELTMLKLPRVEFHFDNVPALKFCLNTDVTNVIPMLAELTLFIQENKMSAITLSEKIMASNRAVLNAKEGGSEYTN